MLPHQPSKQHQLIAKTAYYLAEKESFQGDPIQYWLIAEMEIEKPSTNNRSRYGLLQLPVNTP